MSRRRQSNDGERSYGGVVPAKPELKTDILIDPALVGGGRRRRGSPIDAELYAEEEQEARELRSLRIDEIKERRLTRIAEAQRRRENVKPASNDTMSIVKPLLTDPAVQQQWLALDEEQRNIILSSIAMATGGEKGVGIENAQFRLLLAQSRSKPATSVKEMLELVNLMGGRRDGGSSSLVDAVRLGAELAKKPESEGGTFMQLFVQLIQPLYDALGAKDREYFQIQLNELKAQPQLPQQLQFYKQVASELGFKPPSATGGDANLIEITKMRFNQERYMAEEAWKHEQWRSDMQLKQASETKRWDAIERIGTTWAEKVAPLIDSAIGAGKVAIESRGSKVEDGVKPDMQLSVSCPKCTASIPIPAGNPESLTCPNPECGQVLTRKPPAAG